MRGEMMYVTKTKKDKREKDLIRRSLQESTQSANDNNFHNLIQDIQVKACFFLCWDFLKIIRTEVMELVIYDKLMNM
jgi:hypothetical protein